MNNNQRVAGVLASINCLPSSDGKVKAGIGTFGKPSFYLADKIYEMGCGLWQVLPLCQAGPGDSSYCPSDPLSIDLNLIDLETLFDKGILNEEEYTGVDFGDDERHVDYGALYVNKIKVLKCAFMRETSEMDLMNRKDYVEFKEKNAFWLDDFALYMAIKRFRFNGVSWLDFADDIKERRPYAMEYYKNVVKTEIEMFKYIQYIAFKQWMEVKAYANSKGIKIIGDLPFYAASDSAETWAHPELFSNGVSGCAPDCFCPEGQRWGNPTYNWEYHKQTGYKWWLARIGQAIVMYDIIRIDHFLGLSAYYEIPSWEANAKNGQMKKGPGMDFFNAVKATFGDIDMIAEDLGQVTDEAKRLLSESGCMGMKVLVFAFGSGDDNPYLPQNYGENSNCVVYTGNHDTETMAGWCKDAKPDEIAHAKFIANEYDTNKLAKALVKTAMLSTANIAIIPIQDIIGCDNSGRMNIPGTCGSDLVNGGNWTYRFVESDLTDEKIEEFAELVKSSNR